MRRAAVLEAELANTFRHSLIGRNLDVLVETADEARPGHVLGTACRGTKVSLRGLLPALRRKLVPVRATSVQDDVVLAEPIGEVDPFEYKDSKIIHTMAIPGRLALPVC
jgi:tRNA A37 methylthiotransferase MiaB